MIKDYFKLSYRSVRQRKVRSWLTMIGIFIGIAAVVALMSLSQGLQSAISEQFISLGSDKLTIQAASPGFAPPGEGVSVPLTIKDKDKVAKIREIDVAVGRLLRSVKFKSGSKVEYLYAVTIPDSATVKEYNLINEANDYKIESGRLLEPSDIYKVMVGYNVAYDTFDKDLAVRDRVEIQDQVFKVVGILKKSGNPLKDNSVVVTEKVLRNLLGIEDSYDIIAAKIKTGEDLSYVSEKVSKELRKLRNVDKGKEDFSITTPEQMLATFNTILSIVQGVLVGIAAISLLVGGIGIMNTMYTAVLERTKEIGIMKALGARKRMILLLFLIESGLLGLLGGVIGVSLGFGISKLVEIIAFQIYGSYLIQADFNLLLLVGMLLFGFSVGAISGVLPARQAANLKPVDALRK